MIMRRDRKKRGLGDAQGVHSRSVPSAIRAALSLTMVTEVNAGTKGPGDIRKALSVPWKSILAITPSIFNCFP